MKTLLVLAAGLTLAAQAVPASAEPFEGYLKLEGVKGEVTDGAHKKWMQLLSASDLPAGCSGEEEGGGGLTVRVAKKAKYMPYLGSGNLEGGRAKLDIVESDGEVVSVVLDGVFLSTGFGGSFPRPQVMGDAGYEEIGDGSKIVTLNFTRISWHRSGCAARNIAKR